MIGNTGILKWKEKLFMPNFKEKRDEILDQGAGAAKDGCELDLEDLSQVSGGSNPFANVKRVKTYEIDEDLRNKI